MRRVVTSVVGGPLLPSNSTPSSLSTPLSWTTQTPLLHDPWILLPGLQDVVVLASRTGKRVGRLHVGKQVASVVAVFDQPSSVDDNEATLVVWVGCKDASLVEFVLNRTTLGKRKAGDDALKPRRTLVLAEKAQESIVQLAAIQESKPDGRLLLFALLEQHQTSSHVHARLVRVGVSLTISTSRTPKVVKLYKKRSPNSQETLTVVDERVEYPNRANLASSNKKSYRQSSAPFCLRATHRPKTGSIVILLATRLNLRFYVEIPVNGESAASTDYLTLSKGQMDVKSPLTAVAISPDACDVACGHASGAIRILDQCVAVIETYARAMHAHKNDTNHPKPVHPEKTVLVRKLHWHAHPVASLVYDQASSSSSSGPSVLYSGGEESVLAVWQLNGATTKPASTLPRLGLRGIVHLQASDRHVLVYSADNSLQLIESHNLDKQWHVQGLAAGVFQSGDVKPQLWLDPSNSRRCLAMTGLSQAPGQVHWYDPASQKAMSTLAVTPFNRVSRTEPDDVPLPQPTVTLSAVAAKDLLTVDEVASENTNVGFVRQLDSKTTVGVVTTLRFWSFASGKYEQRAAMTHPHGSENPVSAVAVSEHGHACTVSNADSAFYLWQKRGEVLSAQDDPLWSCRYRVAIPAGYSSFATPSKGVAFSKDSSTLAIAVGSQVTLWDHGNVAFLSSLRLEDDGSNIESIAFVSNKRLTDMLLIQSSAGVHLRSPYGEHCVERLGWTWKLPLSLAKRVRVSQACFLGTSNLVAIVLFHQEKDATRVLLVNAVTGAIHHFEGDDAAVVDGIAGEIVAVCDGTKDMPTASGWSQVPAHMPLHLYMLTASGEMLSLNSGQTTIDLPTNEVDDPSPSLPTIPLLVADNAVDRKRPLTVMQVSDLEPLSKKLSLDHFGALEGETATELPTLRGAFARAFVGRNLQHR